MPELAEVEYYRKQWDSGIRRRVTRVHLHREKRVFRGADLAALERLRGKRLVASAAAAKQMLFRFDKGSFLGIHLGMTGRLSSASKDFEPGKHDHLVLFHEKGALVFTDARQFGRVLIHEGSEPPEWWTKIPPAVTSRAFTFEHMNAFLVRRSKLAIKAALLLQTGFPGIGNWMADEILWRAAIAPARLCGSLTPGEKRRLWREVRYVARVALEKIGSDFGDPPPGWLFHQRWGREGVCPRHRTPLVRQEIGGRTTAWCTNCQH